MPSVKLLVTAGPDRGRTISLVPGLQLIGRSPRARSHLNDPHAAKIHCQIDVRDGRITLADLESGLGTRVNGQFVEEVDLRPDDLIRVGDTELKVLVEATATTPATLARSAPPPANEEILDAEVIDAEVIDDGPAVPAPPRTGAVPRPAPTASPKPSGTRPTVSPPPTPAASKVTALPPERMAELSNTTLGRYEIGDFIARGKQGMVFKALDLDRNRLVALKVLFPTYPANEREMRRFTRAMQTAKPLRHDNVVRTYAAGKTGPYLWYSMKLYEGESLAAAIRRVGVAGMFDWRHAFWIAVRMVQGLEYLHSQQVVHRNLTPLNIMVQFEAKQAVLCDPLLFKALIGPLATQITLADESLGEVLYMSPERTREGALIDARSDLFSLGTLIYELLTGKSPFEGWTIAETVTKIRQAVPDLPKKYQMSIPEAFQGVVLQMLAKRPEDRYQSASEVLRDLMRVAKFQGIAI